MAHLLPGSRLEGIGADRRPRGPRDAAREGPVIPRVRMRGVLGLTGATGLAGLPDRLCRVQTCRIPIGDEGGPYRCAVAGQCSTHDAAPLGVTVPAAARSSLPVLRHARRAGRRSPGRHGPSLHRVKPAASSASIFFGDRGQSWAIAVINFSCSTIIL